MMRVLCKSAVLALALAMTALACGCAQPAPAAPAASQAPVSGAVGSLTVSFTFARVNSVGTNQFAVWIEDESGGYVATLAATRFTAAGGYARRPTSIPEWVRKSGLADMSKTQVDAITSATPASGEVAYAWNCADQDGKPVPPGVYRFVVEGTSDYSDDSGRSVIFAGTIELGGESAQAEAALERADEYAERRGMITGVSAAFAPTR